MYYELELIVTINSFSYIRQMFLEILYNIFNKLYSRKNCMRESLQVCSMYGFQFIYIKSQTLKLKKTIE